MGANVVANITPQPVSISALAIETKPYDGQRSVALSQLAGFSGLVSNENLALDVGALLFSDANAGQGKNVSGTVALRDGAGGLASNYQLTNAAISTTGTITPRPVTLAGVTASDKVYDGSTTASLQGGSLNGLVNGQSLGVSLGTGSFASPAVGAAKLVTAAAALQDGGGGGLAANYQLSNPAISAIAAITPRPVIVSGISAADKIYDGLTTASLATGTVSGAVNGENLTLSLSSGGFADANAGSAKAVTGTLLLQDGNGGQASNYQLTNPNIATTRQHHPAIGHGW